MKAALSNLFDHTYRWGFSSLKMVPKWLRLGTVYESQAGNAAAELWELPEGLRSPVFLGLIFPRNCVLSGIWIKDLLNRLGSSGLRFFLPNLLPFRHPPSKLTEEEANYLTSFWGLVGGGRKLITFVSLIAKFSLKLILSKD